MQATVPISRFRLLWPVIASVILPLAASWFAYPETHLPPEFGVFPPVFVQSAPAFNLAVFLVIALIGVMIAMLFLFPRLFGFKPVAPPPPVAHARFPAWFWAGGLCMIVSWYLMWSHNATFMGGLIYYAFTPLWWGFILVLDGLTYRRNNGKSLLSRKPKMVLLIAIISLVEWCYFEYFNYFVLSNWYYPNGHMRELSHATVVTLFLIAYTTVWPVVLECYTLLNTFTRLRVRYSNGPKVPLPGNLLLWTGFALLILMVFWPYPFFWGVWIGPFLIVSGTLIRSGVWTPYTALAKGNWNPVLLSALSALCIGFFWECWNFGSAHPAMPLPTNPNFWQYEIPYVNAIHLFSEMPLLGYMGYLPFGIVVWLTSIWAGLVFRFDTSMDLD